MNEDLQNKIDELEQKFDKLSSTITDISTSIDGFDSRNILNLQNDVTLRDTIRQIINENIENIMWNNIFYLSSFATASITATDTVEVLDSNGREADTSAGLRFQPTIDSRFKMTFYINEGFTKTNIYIAAPGVSKSASTPTAIIDANQSWVGVKFVAGTMYLVSSTAGSETSTVTSVSITDNTTHTLEIRYLLTHTEFYFDNEYVGDIECDLTSPGSFEVFWPFITSVASQDTTDVNLTIESFEFLQKRK
jgi:hypothetical protein